MYIIKNAWKNITRNKSRNILMSIVIFIIALSSTISLSILSSANKLITSYDNKYDVEATISMNRPNMMKDFNKDSSSTSTEDKTKSNIEKFNKIKNLTKSEIEKYGNSRYVKSYYYTESISMNSSNISKASENMPSDNMPNNMNNDNDESSDSSSKTKNFKMDQGDFKIVGYSSYESLSDFIKGSYKISSGKIFDIEDTSSCVINKELADLNSIKVGDKITLTDPDDESITYELKVTGIFEDSSTESNNDMSSMYSRSANTIITSTNAVDKILEKDSNLNNRINPVYILKDKKYADKFAKEVEDKGLSSSYEVTNNIEDIESETSSIRNVRTFATISLILTLIVGTIVLFVINMINIRERKYEIGVLRTIGMKKTSLAGQFISELMIIAIIGLFAGAVAGAALSVPTANKLLESEIKSSQNEENSIKDNFGGGPPGMNNFKHNMNKQRAEKITSMNAAISYDVVLELLGIGILITLISSTASIAGVARFQPLTILKERS